jgi:hypothetical protein
MRRKHFLWIAVLTIITQSISAQLTPAETNMKLFDDYSPDKTGSTDVSDQLQTAVDWCIANNKTLFIASGTYLVTKKIYARVFIGFNCGIHDGSNMIAITGDAFSHPVIKLKDGATGFQDTNIANAQPVIHVQHDQGDAGESCLFWCQIKNLDFDLGNNPGAVAIRMAAAQDTQISNIKVYGQNFAAGFTGIPGRNSGTFNCEVIGGKYAFYITNSLGATLYGLKCVNQSVAALYIAIWRGPAITGLEISGCGGTGIICRNSSTSNSNARFYQGHLVLTDAKIELNNSSDFALDVADRGLVLRNVYVKGSNNLVKSNSGNWMESFTNWGRIKFLSILPQNINSFATYNIIDDVKNTNQMKEFELSAAAPSNFITKHTPHKIYAFNSPGAVNAAAYGASPGAGASVNYEAIQRAINENDIVYIPAGRYNLSATLNLKNNSVLIGDPGKRSQLTPTYNPTSHSWMITTPNIDGYAVVQDMAFDIPDKNYYGGIKWQTSDGFILNVRNYLSSGWNERARINFLFTGKAGGRFFGITEQTGLYDSQLNPNPDYHKVVVEGTTNPITFYGLNLERGGNAGEVPQNPYASFINSGNIRVFGTKSETDGLVYSISGCNNVSLNFIMAHAHIANLVDSRIVGVYNNSRNIEVNIVVCPYTTTAGLTMIDDDTNDYVKRDQFLGTYRIGSFDPSVFDRNEATAISNSPISCAFVYPTLTDGQLMVQNPDRVINIKLIDNAGRVIQQWSATNHIDLSEYSEGFYLIQITEDSGSVAVHKIVKL